ncbi:MAG: hypothetical protein HYZ54_01955 [Ignavibacteriae bacterium]|nr:hypothetical protein [Ignavibacteriota bacterium]
MSKEKYRCYACNRLLTKNGTDLRKDPDVRVQRCSCRREECGISNVFIIVESEDQSLIGKYLFPKVKGKAFTYEEAVRKFQAKKKLLGMQDTEEVLEEFADDKLEEFIAESNEIKEEAVQVKKLVYRKKAVEAALERNRKKVVTLAEELEELEIKIEEIQHYKKTIRTLEEAKLRAEEIKNSVGQSLKSS